MLSRIQYSSLALLIVSNVMIFSGDESGQKSAPNVHEQLKVLICTASSPEAWQSYREQLRTCTEKELKDIDRALDAWGEGHIMTGRLRVNPRLWVNFSRFVEHFDSPTPQLNEQELHKLKRCNLLDGRLIDDIVKHIGTASWSCFVELKKHIETHIEEYIDGDSAKELQVWDYLDIVEQNLQELKTSMSSARYHQYAETTYNSYDHMSAERSFSTEHENKNK